MPLNYSKWDNLDDSDDEAPPPHNEVAPSRQQQQQRGASGQTQQTTVKAAFILKSKALADGRQIYINVCSSNAVDGGLSAKPASVKGLNATLPYIVGDLRTDEDANGDGCYVVEALFHPDTMGTAEKNKQTAETVITTALAVVSELATPVDQKEWSVFEPDALRERNGAHFFAPGKLRPATKAVE